jgi:hypothetical protein
MPLPGIGYLLLLIGFAALGVFIGGLAYQSENAPAAGMITMVAFVLSIACFVIRKYDVEHSEGEAALLSVDPLRTAPIDSASRQRYLDRYRHGAAAKA